MAELIWDKSGERFYETGVSKGVLFVYDAKTKKYLPGVAWNGLTAVNESPTGADTTELWADNINYLNLVSAEKFECTIEAYMYPDAWAACDGSAELKTGITIGQQPRSKFAFAYQTKVGSDLDPEAGYKIHIVYGCSAAPSGKDYNTVNDSPDAMTMSWSVSTTPVEVTGHNPSATVVIDSRTTTAATLKSITDSLYGTSSKESTLLMPNDILALS